VSSVVVLAMMHGHRSIRPRMYRLRRPAPVQSFQVPAITAGEERLAITVGPKRLAITVGQERPEAEETRIVPKTARRRHDRSFLVLPGVDLEEPPRPATRPRKPRSKKAKQQQLAAPDKVPDREEEDEEMEEESEAEQNRHLHKANVPRPHEIESTRYRRGK
jgi:hypothetical protein